MVKLSRRNGIRYGVRRASSQILLLTWFNFNPRMDKNHIHYKVWDEITYSFLNFDGCTVEV